MCIYAFSIMRTNIDIGDQLLQSATTMSRPAIKTNPKLPRLRLPKNR
jgi:hypothetical protein